MANTTKTTENITQALLFQAIDIQSQEDRNLAVLNNFELHQKLKLYDDSLHLWGYHC